MKNIYTIRKTFQGAWSISGTIGSRQYMGYTKKQAIKLYQNEIIKCEVQNDKSSNGNNHIANNNKLFDSNIKGRERQAKESKDDNLLE